MGCLKPNSENLARYRIHLSVHKNGLRLDKAKKGHRRRRRSRSLNGVRSASNSKRGSLSDGRRLHSPKGKGPRSTIPDNRPPRRSQSRHPRRDTKGESHERPSNRLDTRTEHLRGLS
ncbi:hypothetical protein HMPREF0972_00759 [Actinomyces sp. oral taxon 848 str. F0332]|nr:hypothetical protein HMPREF0972_00759 [Actinomyces sp. oral taxon 848 str. F0332]